MIGKASSILTLPCASLAYVALQDMTDAAIGAAATELCKEGVRNKAVSQQPWITDRYFLVKYEQVR